MVAILACGLRVGSGLSPPAILDPKPTVTVTPVSSGGASSGRLRESRSMTRRPAASSSRATSYVLGAVVPSGISSTAVARSPSTSSASVVGTIPAGSREMLSTSIATAPDIVTPGRAVANRRARSRGPCTNRCSWTSTRLWSPEKNRSKALRGTQSGPGRWDRWLGRTNSDSTSETTSMAIRMIGRARHTSPTPPGMNSSGTKATAEVRTANVNGTLIRRTPRIAAATPGVPRLRSF